MKYKTLKRTITTSLCKFFASHLEHLHEVLSTQVQQVDS